MGFSYHTFLNNTGLLQQASGPRKKNYIQYSHQKGKHPVHTATNSDFPAHRFEPPLNSITYNSQHRAELNAARCIVNDPMGFGRP